MLKEIDSHSGIRGRKLSFDFGRYPLSYVKRICYKRQPNHGKMYEGMISIWPLGTHVLIAFLWAANVNKLSESIIKQMVSVYTVITSITVEMYTKTLIETYHKYYKYNQHK